MPYLGVAMKKFTLFDLIKGLSFTILSYLIVRWSLQAIIYVVINQDRLALKEWISSIFLFVVCIVVISTIISKFNENRYERDLVRYAYGESKSNFLKNSISLSYPLGSMPLLWGIGIVILLIGYYENHHMFYVYFYFFAAGLFPLAYSLLKQISFDENGLKLFFGSFFRRRCIILRWNQISGISYTTYETSYMASAGGRIRVPYKMTQQNEGLLIKLADKLSQSEQSLILESKGGFFAKDELEIDIETPKIILKRAPKGGFKSFLNKIKKYTDVKSIVEKESAMDRFLYVFAHAASFIFISLALLCLYLFR
jgi:hypothetical protein